MNRRDLLSLACMSVSASMFPGVNIASAVPLSLGQEEPVNFPENVLVPTIDEYARRGLETPSRAEIVVADKILNAAPKNCSPIDVAKFFLDMKSGFYNDVFNDGVDSYCEEWPIRANPVIVRFFDATNRIPAGDQTAWCAAFVNWCIVRSREEKQAPAALRAPTRSAASKSFRAWGQETTSPVFGDLVVFKHKRNADQGHVGFVTAVDARGVFVLGGNQMPLRARTAEGTYDRKNTGEVNIKWLPNDGKDLAFHSFRTDPSLH